MTCRHEKYDPSCSSYQSSLVTLAADYRAQFVNTPDASQYEVEDAKEVNGNLVMKVKYPNCAKCSYEGTKIMVFTGVKMKDALMWRTIDPHFRAGVPKAKEAPSPVARFPGSDKGWRDALEYAARQQATGTQESR